MLHVDHAALVDLVDASYANEDDRESSVVRTLGVVMSMVSARSGAFIRFRVGYDAGAFGLRDAGDIRLIGPDHCWSPATVQAILDTPGSEGPFGRTQGGTCSQLSGLGSSLAGLPSRRTCWKEPVVDSLGVVSVDARGSGIAACAALDETRSLPSREARLLMRLATHVGASGRLRAVERVRRLDRRP